MHLNLRNFLAVAILLFPIFCNAAGFGVGDITTGVLNGLPSLMGFMKNKLTTPDTAKYDIDENKARVEFEQKIAGMPDDQKIAMRLKFESVMSSTKTLSNFAKEQEIAKHDAPLDVAGIAGAVVGGAVMNHTMVDQAVIMDKAGVFNAQKNVANNAINLSPSSTNSVADVAALAITHPAEVEKAGQIVGNALGKLSGFFNKKKDEKLQANEVE